MSSQAFLVETGRSQPASKVRRFLTQELGYSCRELNWQVFDVDAVRRSAPDLLVLVASCAEDPLPTFRRLSANPIHVPILSVLPYRADSELFRLASAATDDFVLWPIREEELRERLCRVLASHPSHIESVARSLTAELGLTQLVGKDPVFVCVTDKLPVIAGSEAPVLIDGETGTGKELCARAAHFLSARREGPFIPVDCGAIPDHLFENEFFGHVRGAFTDASSEQKGLAAMASEGTLFLDEVDTLSTFNQTKLLRFLQDLSYRPLGGQAFLRADARIMAATNSNLEECVATGSFRSDLYYRLNVLRLSLPPLRERRLDIPLLALDHLRSLTNQPPGISTSAQRLLMSYDWPGNVRELFNIVHRAFIQSNGHLIQAHHVSLPGVDVDRFSHPHRFAEARSLVIESFERRYVEEMLARHDGNITRAAREAGKERRAFGRLVKKYDIDPRDL
jgi:DNA-binding NtrC family response regulator